VITRPPDGQDPVELGEAQVVTDGQADLRAVGIGQLDLISGLLDLGFAIGDVADLHVEHVDLPVDGEPLPSRGEHHGGVGELLLAGDDLGNASGDEEDPELSGPAGRGTKRGAIQRLGRSTNRIGRTEHGPLLGQDDQLSPIGGGLPHKPLCDLEVAVVSIRGIQLYGGSAHITGSVD